MSTTTKKQTAEQLLFGYADVLNKANIESISSFYSFDGMFMPDGFKNLSKKDLEAAGRNFFNSHTFNIKYDIQTVTISNDFAFIEASAQTTTVPHGGEAVIRNSKDFFVLRRDSADWKIYRYIYNKMQGQ